MVDGELFWRRLGIWGTRRQAQTPQVSGINSQTQWISIQFDSVSKSLDMECCNDEIQLTRSMHPEYNPMFPRASNIGTILEDKRQNHLPNSSAHAILPKFHEYAISKNCESAHNAILQHLKYQTWKSKKCCVTQASRILRPCCIGPLTTYAILPSAQ